MLKEERQAHRDKAVKVLKRAESSLASADVDKQKKADKFTRIAEGYIALAISDVPVPK